MSYWLPFHICNFISYHFFTILLDTYVNIIGFILFIVNFVFIFQLCHERNIMFLVLLIICRSYYMIECVFHFVHYQLWYIPCFSRKWYVEIKVYFMYFYWFIVFLQCILLLLIYCKLIIFSLFIIIFNRLDFVKMMHQWKIILLLWIMK